MRWKVAEDFLIFFGCTDPNKINAALAAAQAKGTTPEDVLGLIDYAAHGPDGSAPAIVECDRNGKPIGYWSLPSWRGMLNAEAVTAIEPQGPRIYAWRPGLLLYLISTFRPGMFIADLFRKKSVEFVEAQRVLAARAIAPAVHKPSVATSATSSAALSDAMAEIEQLEREHGAALDDLIREEALGLLPAIAQASFRRSGDDPRDSKQFRSTLLRAFARRVGQPSGDLPETSAANEPPRQEDAKGDA